MSADDHHEHDDDHDHHHGAKRVGGLAILGQLPGQWRSPEERAGVRPDDAEFPPGADTLEGVQRRDFMQLLGASLALTTTACYRPNQKIVPFVRRPPEVTPGNALHFATAYSLDGLGSGL